MITRDKVIVSVIVAQFVILALIKVRAARSAEGSYQNETRVSAKEFIGDDRSVTGTSAAKYTLVEFGDYQCPPCARMSGEIAKLLVRHPKELKFRFRNYPLPIHNLAAGAANFAEISRNRGLFELVHMDLYRLNTDVGPVKIVGLAQRYGIDMRRLSASELAAARSAVASDVALGKSVSVSGTPTLFLCTPDAKVLRLDSVALVDGLIK